MGVKEDVETAKAKGVTSVQMMDNIDAHIDRCLCVIGECVKRFPSDYECARLEQLFAELRQKRDYRAAALDILLTIR